ncbi:uncharacterized protein MPTK1_3g05870 [Marchantia polymorpha subsp. ruderalis]|uniref:HD/PDEase domain-containing protein n=2 Tax=Marchantia polymorpha TaxID=3197 RepID=A0AAF6AXU7_MARPO|nr:hypothetical protein MARPO_0006s0058 [Marchantia polymorpha]BBN04581.1 hypothetical protein Mp_3g05870 [Marchantia polymorpha subsp. ruderalis]|eukprot:PTQ48018.1 hypothetical protein MARPO_0006s0058 [Marchantia polymorpha]
MNMEEVVKAAEELVHNVMGKWDSSHDPFHVYRVRNLALSLAAEEGLSPESCEIVELAALLHDIDDHKYASRDKRVEPTAEEFLAQHRIEPIKKEAVMTIIQSMGFKEELNASSQWKYSPELAVVQDADRLDAIGAIGIGRTFTFGGARNCPMFDPDVLPRTKMTKEEYVSTKTTTINHFHEKLLKLRDLMKSQAGRRRADGRHKFMEDFLSQFESEWKGEL